MKLRDAIRKEQRGPATVEFLSGIPTRVTQCRFNDGTRGDMLKSEESDDSNILFRRRMPDGSYKYGSIEMLPDDVVFIESDFRPGILIPEESEPSLHRDLLLSSRIKRLAESEEFARALYGALTNAIWGFGSFEWSCSFRTAAGIVADLRERGEEYTDFYCAHDEGIVYPEIEEEFLKLGWKLIRQAGR